MNNNLEAGEFNIELKEEEPVWIVLFLSFCSL